MDNECTCEHGGLLKPDVVEGLQVSEVGLVGVMEALGAVAYRGESSLGYSILATESIPFNSLSCRLFKLLDLHIAGGLVCF
ncbi:hypothetical protein Syun_014551 [Stephania yunnanensis]|uniref:Uncharacterized protein n=1 Tax=Stephania yunnanensis TaxID=152371 RepID=A0AAP0PC19_9MAGN